MSRYIDFILKNVVNMRFFIIDYTIIIVFFYFNLIGQFALFDNESGVITLFHHYFVIGKSISLINFEPIAVPFVGTYRVDIDFDAFIRIVPTQKFVCVKSYFFIVAHITGVFQNHKIASQRIAVCEAFAVFEFFVKEAAYSEFYERAVAVVIAQFAFQTETGLFGSAHAVPNVKVVIPVGNTRSRDGYVHVGSVSSSIHYVVAADKFNGKR